MKKVQSLGEMNALQMMKRGWGGRAWWEKNKKIPSVFLHSPNKWFWAYLGDLRTGMPRRPEILGFSYKTRLRYPWVG